MTEFTDDPKFLAELKVTPPKHPIMFAGWDGCVSWASQKPECIEQFLSDTGAKSFNRNDRASMLVFVDWVTRTVWGE